MVCYRTEGLQFVCRIFVAFSFCLILKSVLKVFEKLLRAKFVFRSDFRSILDPVCKSVDKTTVRLVSVKESFSFFSFSFHWLHLYTEKSSIALPVSLDFRPSIGISALFFHFAVYSQHFYQIIFVVFCV